MKSYAVEFSSIEHLQNFIKTNKLARSRGVIQVFCGTPELKQVQRVLDFLAQSCLGFMVIGASSAGEIIEGTCVDNKIILSFLVLTKGRVSTFYSPTADKTSGATIAAGHVEPATKVGVLFGNPNGGDPEQFIQGFSEVSPQVVLAGGNAAEQTSSKQTFIIRDNQIFRSGIAGVMINSDELKAESNSILSWRKVGRTMTVTSMRDNVLYSLDDTPVMDVYRQMLGDDIFDNFPDSARNFPLLIERDGIEIARSATALDKKRNGIQYAGGFQKGDQVSFSFAHIASAMALKQEFIAATDTASLIYSSATRKLLLHEIIKDEIATAGKHTRASGFFAQGEYFHKQAKSNLLNATTTMLTLSDTPKSVDGTLVKNRPAPPAEGKKVTMLERLSHLASVVGDDLTQTRQMLQQHRRALDDTAIISITDVRGDITYVNSLFEDISGYKSAELVGQNHRKIRHPDMPDSIFKDLWRTVAGKNVWSGMIKNRKKNGGFYYVKTTVVPILDHRGSIKEYFSIRTDVTAFVMAQKRIKEHLNDSLSGLATRARLSKDIKKNNVTAVAVLDVRNFKLLNDYWGVETGDKLIADIGKRLRNNVAGHNLKAYRLDGAVFAVTALQQTDEKLFRENVESIKTNLEHEITDGHAQSIATEIQFSAGIGFSSSNPLPHAESALIQAKSSNSHQIMVQHENDEAELSFYWINEVREALNEGRLRAFYQEIRPTKPDPGASRKYEALLRLKLPNGKIASPGAFLPIIKRTPYYKRLTSFIVRDALKTTKVLNCTVSVNLSIHDITNKSTVAETIRLLREYGGKSLIFEITESEAVTDFVPVNKFIQSVRKYGAKVAIDDFGSGYSNFDYLINLKPDYIKIDGSIIQKIVSHEQTMLVTQGIIDLAHKMGAQVVAEFVSDEQIEQKLAKSGIDFMQGYHIQKPIPLTEDETTQSTMD